MQVTDDDSIFCSTGGLEYGCYSKLLFTKNQRIANCQVEGGSCLRTDEQFIGLCRGGAFPLPPVLQGQFRFKIDPHEEDIFAFDRSCAKYFWCD